MNGEHRITGVPTSITAFVGTAESGAANVSTLCLSVSDYVHPFGGLSADFPMSLAVRDFFANGGREAIVVRVGGDPPGAADYLGSPEARTGLFALENAAIFNLLCIPPAARGGDTDTEVYQAALTYCVKRRALLIVDPPAAWHKASDITGNEAQALTDLGLSGEDARNAALYFPRIREADPLQPGQADAQVPCGCIAGIMARNDAKQGVGKAPAGLDATVNGIEGLAVTLPAAETEHLNALGVNCLRTFPNSGTVVWGARTLRAKDAPNDEYKYIPIRRLALFLEESLSRGLQWVGFEPNDETLYEQIRESVGDFLHGLFVQGAFTGSAPQTAYFVKCDAATTTQNDLDQGIVNVVVGFAPLKPAEFVIIQIQLLTLRD